MFVASLPFGEGAFGMGDVKFLVAIGLLIGFLRLVIALFAGVMIGGVAIFALLIARRVTLKSYIPFGPFLIIGAIWAILLPASS
jgi:leader peptidase (prepilin peptidase)/N-methyltransferase